MASPVVNLATPTSSTTDSSSSLKRKADAMESSEPSVTAPRNAKVIELQLQSEADVTLKVGNGDDAVDIKVSGTVLSLASKVFKTMLSSNFNEGSTKVIELPDDKPQTYLDFCHIILHQGDSVHGMDASRMRELIVLADMRDAREALRPWIVSEMVNRLAWFNSDLTSTTPEYVAHVSLQGFEIAEFIPFAASFGLDDLFYKATLAYLMREDRHILELNPTRNLALMTAPIDSHGVSLYDFLNEKRQEVIRELLQDLMKAIATDYGTYKRGRRFKAANFCKASQAKYGTLLSWFLMEGINTADLQSYKGSWSMAMTSIGGIANKKSGSPDPDGGLEGENWIKQCKTTDCTYCSMNIKKRLRELKTKKTNEMAGVCFKCFLENGRDDCLHCSTHLHRNSCRKPGHSNRGRGLQFKAS